MFAVGDVVAARYEVEAVVGKRPLGWVYRAREREIGVEVALRAMGHDVLPDEAARQAFIQRVSRARAFSHPNLVRVFGVYPTTHEVVVVVQSAPGQTLRERIQERLFTVEEARPLWTQAAQALTHAHQHGVVLADMHVQTVVLLEKAIKVSNVGIGPALPRKLFLEAVRDEPGYQELAPELKAGGNIDARADVYALAMLVVQMLTGKPALPDTKDALGSALGRALSDDPLLRQATVEALLADIESALGGAPAPRPRRPTPPPINLREKPAPKADKTLSAPSPDETRAIEPAELEVLHGEQVTRQVEKDELFALRVASSDTQQVELADVLVHPSETSGEELALEAAPPADEAMTTDELMALKTTEHPRLPPPVVEEEIDTTEVPRTAAGLERLDPQADPNLTPLPPPAPAGPLTPPPAAAPGGKASPPKVVVSKSAALSLADAHAPSTSVETPDAIAKRRSSAEEGIEDDDNLPTNMLPSLPPRAEPPPAPRQRPAPRTRRNPFAGDAMPAAEVQRRSMPAPTAQVSPAPRRHGPPVVLVAVAAFIAAVGVALALAHYLNGERLAEERRQKQRLADELNARADALRHSLVLDAGTAPAPETPKPEAVIAPPPTGGPCPLGANLVSAGGHSFCVDVYEYPGGNAVPRTRVSFADAGRICAARKERLCSESEWERACRGKGNTSYPYGGVFDPSRCNTAGPELSPAGKFASCKSAAGAYDMSGNVAEWVASGAQKGGSILQGAHETRCSFTHRTAPPEGGDLVGFRCCADPVESE